MINFYWGEKKLMPEMKVKETVIFDGNDEGFEFEGSIFRLACGPSVTEVQNGELLCTWLTGSRKEPAPDNCLVLSRSFDGGETWSKPEMLVPPGEENGSGCILNGDGKLVLLSARWPLKDAYTVWHYSRSESYDNGRTWTEKTPLKLIDQKGFSACLGGEIKTSGGEYLCCAQIFQKRERPFTAGAGRLALAKSEEEALAMSPMEPGEIDPNKFATHLHGCGVFKTDQDKTGYECLGWVHNRPLGLLEPTMVELRDGTLVMLMRAEWGGVLWRSDSRDGGRTWCDAYPTSIKNPSSLAHLLRLPDGRIALLNNHFGGFIGEPMRLEDRDPLSLWISDDELKSFSVKEDIIKGGWLSYPYAIALRDGRYTFVYDRNRRQIVFVEVSF